MEEEVDNHHGVSSEMEEDSEEEESVVCGSIKKLSRYIEQGFKNVSNQSERKRNVIVVGLTGSGKSTLINSMAGCKMRQISQSRAVANGWPTDTIVVHGSQHTKIGHSLTTSETKLVKAIPVEGQSDIILWDAPGFEDSKGEEQNIANAVNLQRLLTTSSQGSALKQSDLVILVVLDAPSLFSTRGDQVKRTMETLSALFGGQQQDGQSTLQKHLPSMVFILTKTSRVTHASLDAMKQWVVTFAKDSGITLDGYLDKIVAYDPLDDSHKTHLKSLIAGVQPVARGQRFRTTLNAKDERRLREIFIECKSSITKCMQEADSGGAERAWKLLDVLQVIDHDEIAKCVQEVRTMVVDVAQGWKEKVRALHTDNSAKGRKEVKCLLGLFNTYLPFVKDVGKSDLQNDYVELDQEVKQQEAMHQEHENAALKERFSPLQTALVRALIKRADDDIDRGDSKSEFRTYPDKKFEPSLEDVRCIAASKEGREVMSFLAGAKKRAEGRGHYVHGDQHSIEDLVQRWRADILKIYNGIKREWNINSDLRVIVKRLHDHSDHAVEAKFSELCVHNLSADKISDLTGLGFDKIETDVQRVCSLVKESADLLSGRDRLTRLRSTEKVDSVVNKFLVSLKQQAVDRQRKWKNDVDKLISEINNILHEEQYERDAVQLGKALQSLKQQHVEAKYKEVLAQIQQKINTFQGTGDLETLAKAENYAENMRRNRTLRKLKIELEAHMPDLNASPIHVFAANHLLKLGEEVTEEIERGEPKDPHYLKLTCLRKFMEILKTVRGAFHEDVDEFEKTLKDRSKAKLGQIVDLTKQEVERTGRERMTAESQERISKMLVKGFSIATELSMQSYFKDRIQVVLGKGLDDSGFYVIGSSLERMAAGGLAGVQGGVEAAEMARAIIDEFPEFKNFNTRLFNRKDQGVRYVALTLLSFSSHAMSYTALFLAWNPKHAVSSPA